MTPKEKAYKLFISFGYSIRKQRKDGMYKFDVAKAKELAIMAVDEILEATKTHIDRPEIVTHHYSTFWVAVKVEIENI